MSLASRHLRELSCTRPEILSRSYQTKWLDDRAAVKVMLKNRQVGATWLLALDAVTAAMSGPRSSSTLYLATSRDQGRQFLEYCHWWARQLGHDSNALQRGDRLEFISEQCIEIAAPTNAAYCRPAGRGWGTIAIDEAHDIPDLTSLLRSFCLSQSDATLSMTVTGSSESRNTIDIAMRDAGLLEYSFHGPVTSSDAMGRE